MRCVLVALNGIPVCGSETRIDFGGDQPADRDPIVTKFTLAKVRKTARYG